MIRVKNNCQEAKVCGIKIDNGGSGTETWKGMEEKKPRVPKAHDNFPEA